MSLSSTKRASRAEIFGDNDKEEDSTAERSLFLLRRLDQLVQSSLGDITSLRTQILTARASQPRRRVVQDNSSSKDVCIPFCLLSSSPKGISLQPKPPPPSKNREPETEDNDAEAEQRKERAESVAVDSEWVFEESKRSFLKPFRTSWREETRFVLPQLSELPTQAPPLLLTSSVQRPRKTRPPVPLSELAHVPYASKRSSRPAPCHHGQMKCLCLPLPSPPTPVVRKRAPRQRNRERRRNVGNWTPRQNPSCLLAKDRIEWADYDWLRVATT